MIFSEHKKEVAKLTIKEKYQEIYYRVCVENQEKYHKLTLQNNKTHDENIFLLCFKKLKEYVEILDNDGKLENEMRQLYFSDARACIRMIEKFLDTNNWIL